MFSVSCVQSLVNLVTLYHWYHWTQELIGFATRTQRSNCSWMLQSCKYVWAFEIHQSTRWGYLTCSPAAWRSTWFSRSRWSTDMRKAQRGWFERRMWLVLTLKPFTIFMWNALNWQHIFQTNHDSLRNLLPPYALKAWDKFHLWVGFRNGSPSVGIFIANFDSTRYIV